MGAYIQYRPQLQLYPRIIARISHRCTCWRRVALLIHISVTCMARQDLNSDSESVCADILDPHHRAVSSCYVPLVCFCLSLSESMWLMVFKKRIWTEKQWLCVRVCVSLRNTMVLQLISPQCLWIYPVCWPFCYAACLCVCARNDKEHTNTLSSSSSASW